MMQPHKSLFPIDDEALCTHRTHIVGEFRDAMWIIKFGVQYPGARGLEITETDASVGE
jgi:hypothetical protein